MDHQAPHIQFAQVLAGSIGYLKPPLSADRFNEDYFNPKTDLPQGFPSGWMPQGNGMKIFLAADTSRRITALSSRRPVPRGI